MVALYKLKTFHMIVLKYSLSGRVRTEFFSVRGYVDKDERSQNEIFINVYFLGLKIWRWKVWSEDVPSWAIIKRATLGYSEWRSQRPNLIDACVLNKTIKTISI